MILPTADCRRRFGSADRAVLATTGSDLRPHLVPVTFALHLGPATAGADLAADPSGEPPGQPPGDVVLLAVDHKPKTTRDLRRLRNLAENPRAALLVDHYAPDWTHLWWVRADCTTTVVPEADVAPLAAKYRQYAENPPTGPFILAQVNRWTGWSAS